MLSPVSAPLETIDPLILWLIVIVADALFAGLPGLRTALALPLRFVDRTTLWLDRKLNREQRSIANRLCRGALLVCVLVLAAYGAGCPPEQDGLADRDGRFAGPEAAEAARSSEVLDLDRHFRVGIEPGLEYRGLPRTNVPGERGELWVV